MITVGTYVFTFRLQRIRAIEAYNQSSVYMSIDDAPVKEIMKDMMEMSRGVQHPMRYSRFHLNPPPPNPTYTDGWWAILSRGLFLRYYLSGQSRDYLPTGSGDG